MLQHHEGDDVAVRFEIPSQIEQTVQRGQLRARHPDHGVRVVHIGDLDIPHMEDRRVPTRDVPPAPAIFQPCPVV